MEATVLELGEVGKRGRMEEGRASLLPASSALDVRSLGFGIVGRAVSRMHWLSCADHAMGMFSPGVGPGLGVWPR